MGHLILDAHRDLAAVSEESRATFHQVTDTLEADLEGTETRSQIPAAPWSPSFGNIRSADHPKLIERKEGWATRIEQRAAAQAEAAAPTAAAYAQFTALSMQRRTLADAAQLALTRFKRDLENLGMTEAQIHEIIPDAPSGNGPTPVATPPAPRPS